MVPMEKEEENQPDSGRLGEQSETRPHQENLMTQVVSVDQKSYFLDVRENERGKYLKLTESSQKRRSTILLSGFALKSLQTVLDDAIKENYVADGLVTEELDNHWQTILSRRVQSRNKKIYIDLMQNKRGRSLNIAEVSENRPKTAVVVSERGWLQFKRALEEIYEKFPELNDNQTFNRQPDTRVYSNRTNREESGGSAARSKSTILGSKKLTQNNKHLFFDFLENEQGKYLKISELKRNKRETLFLPSVCFEIFISLLTLFAGGDVITHVDGVEELESPENDTEEHRTLARKVITLEENDSEEVRKYHLDLRENTHGRFLRVTEVRPTKSNCVFFPSDCFLEIKDILAEFNAVCSGDQ